MQTLGGLLLHRGQHLAVSGKGESCIPIGIAGDRLKRSPATWNESDLCPRETWTRLLIVGKNSAAVGQPFQFENGLVVESGESPGFSTIGFHQLNSAKSLARLKQALGEIFTIRRPGQK